MILVEIDYQLTGIESLKRKQVNDALKAAWRAVGVKWRRKFLPLHFGYKAETRYNYTPRSGDDVRPFKGSYQEKKLRFLNHTRPLEFTGEGKRLALFTERLTVTRDKVVIRLPRKFNLRNTNSRVRMADEIRRVLPEERRELAEFFVFVLEKELRRRGASNATAQINQPLPIAA